MFRPLLRWSSSGWIYKGNKNTRNCRTVNVEPLSVIVESPSLYGHKFSACILKTDKILVPKTNETVCIVCRLYAHCVLRRGAYQKRGVSALLTVTGIQKAFPNGAVNGQSEEVTGWHRKLWNTTHDDTTNPITTFRRTRCGQSVTPSKWAQTLKETWMNRSCNKKIKR
jgi:hypothetical protein